MLLIAVAFVLMCRNGALLIDQAVAPEPWVAEVAKLTAVYIGPRHLLVLAHVVPVEGADLVGDIGRLRRQLLALPAVAEVEITSVERAN
jgi:hypothetical protein